MKELISRPQSQKERWGVRRAHICAIVKDEGRYIREWLAYHNAIGFEHFYIYDNESTDDTRQALEAAAERGRSGCVINISSHAGVRPKGASIPYAASKAALNHMTRLLALALAPRIRVNAVAPGLVDTPLTVEWTQAQDLWRERAPMRRAAQPADVAQAVAMLAASDYVTGEILLLDGGLNLT